MRAEVMAWGLTDELVDPGETLLRLVAQSSRRASLYAGLLEQAYDAAERLKQAEATLPDLRKDLETTARKDLDRVFNTGGVGALIGNVYTSGKDVGIFAASEAIRALVELEAAERDRCARFCKLAIDAGIEAKKVEVAQRQVDILDALLRGVLSDLGHDTADPVVQGVVLKRMDTLALGT